MRKLVGVFVIGMSALMPLSASGEDGPVRTFNGGGEKQIPQSVEEAAKDEFKGQFAKAYLAHRKAGGTPADFPGGLAPLEMELNGGESLGTMSIMAYPAPYASNALSPSPSYQAQETNYYCGPASAWVALKHRGAGNNHFGAPLNQTNLATWYWLNTTTEGTARGVNWSHTLNSWTDGTDAGWYIVHNYGSYAPAEDVASKFATNIDSSYAPIMNVWMTAARGRLPGWETYGDVKHYVPGFGYGQYGDYLHYVEVFASVGLGYKYNISKEFFAGIVASYGMIW